MVSLLSQQERNEAIVICENISPEELRKYYTLSEHDLSNISKYKTNPNRLGFAVQLCVLKHKGWSLSYIKNVPNNIIEYVAQQLNINETHYECYHKRKNTIFEHFKDIKFIYGYQELAEESGRSLIAFLDTLFKKSDSSYFLIFSCMEKLKSMMIILPAIYKIEEIVGEARARNEEKIINAINESLTDEQKKKFDLLLDSNGESSFSLLA